MSINFIKRELVLNHQIEKVWASITQPTALRQWFGSDANFDLKEGALGYFEWTEECEGRFAMQVKAIKPYSYFAYKWMYDADVAFIDEQATLVEWLLQPTVSGKTHLVMIESGFREEKHRKMNMQGWLQELNDLELYMS